MKNLFLIMMVSTIFSVICLEVTAQTPKGLSEINEGKNQMAQNFRALSRAVMILGAFFGLLGD